MRISTSFEMSGFAVSARTAPKELADAPLMKPLEATGRFWLPGIMDKQISGNLYYAPGRDTSVITQGSFFGSRYSGAQRHEPAIHGQLFNGAPCTLLNASIYENGYLTEDGPEDHLWLEIFGKSLILGVHAVPTEELPLKDVSVQFSHLDQWFDNPYEISRQKGQSEIATVKFILPEVLLPFLSGGRQATVRVDCLRGIPSSIPANDVSWTFAHQLLITPEQPAPLSWFITAVASLRRFFTFLIGSSVYTLKLEGTTAESQQPNNVLLYPTITVPASVRISQRYFHCKYSDVREALPALVSSWGENAEKLDTVMRGIQDLCTIDGVAPEGLFLAVTQLLEHFDGVLHPETSFVLPPATWRKFLKWLRMHYKSGELAAPANAAQLTEKQEEIICQRIGGANRIPFRSRLHRMFGGVPTQVILPVLGNPLDCAIYIEDMLRRVQRTRDYLTHLGGERPSDVFSIHEMEKVTTQCWCVLIYWTAHSLGLNEKLCDEITYNARNALFLVSGGKEL